MDKYTVKLYARANRDLDSIFTYIAENLLEPDTALNMVDELENAIFSLEQRQRTLSMNYGGRRLMFWKR